MELAVAAHLCLYVIGVSWAFGGNADWVRTPISIWGSLGFLLTLFALASGRRGAGHAPGAFAWAWPVVALNAMVVASCLTPGFRYLDYGGQLMMMPVRVHWWIPSATRATLALHALWLFDGIYFSCINVALAVTRRKTIRVLLAVLVGNAVALSIFGTVQKLVGATGIYFGSVKSPQDYFFASFVYDNHWGAFTLLMVAACIGLVLRHARGSHAGGFFHGPALAGILAIALLGISIPLSGSRACTLLLGLLLCIAFVKGASTMSRALRTSGVAPGGLYFAIAVAAILAVAGGWIVAGDAIQARIFKTREQVTAMWAHRGLGSRAVLYRDTWRMAEERIVFGWGMGSYPTVFSSLYNTQESKADNLPVIYHDAHSDWLQSIAEIGLVGTALMGAAVLGPMLSLRRLRVTIVPYFLLAGCALIAAYSWVEFPFGNVAVVLAWWLLGFCAVQYARLTEAPREGGPAA
jgi:O-antigen ligase